MQRYLDLMRLAAPLCNWSSLTIRLCSSNSAYKDKWPAKLRELEHRNPVRLKRHPEFFSGRPNQSSHDHIHIINFDRFAVGRYDKEKVSTINNSYENRQNHFRHENDQYNNHYNRMERNRYDDFSKRNRNFRKRDSSYYNDSDWQDDSFLTRDRYYDELRQPVSRHQKNKSLAHQMMNQSYDDDSFDDFEDDVTARHPSVIEDHQVDSGETETFGQFSSESKQRMAELVGTGSIENDEPDDNFIRLNATNGPRCLLTYEIKIERLCARARMVEAQDLFDKIVNEYRVKPTSFMYSNLIRGYASTGNMDKCFKLYNQTKKRGLKVTNHFYTSLFHACANYTGDKDVALENATNLLGILRHNGAELHPITYKSAAKAFGVLGDIETAFQLADECPSDGRYDAYMLSSLLIACNSHKDAGFQLAIGAWRMMRKKTMINLTTYQYNLLLRSLATGAGDEDSFKELIQRKIANEVKQLNTPSGLEETKPPLLMSLNINTDSKGLIKESLTESESNELNASEDNSASVVLAPNTCELSDSSAAKQEALFQTIPDILHPKKKIPAEIKITDLKSSAHRLMLIGGVRGVLARMDTHKCKPDIKTFFYLLRALSLEEKNEQELLTVMKEYHVAPDVPFYNYILIRMSHRNHHSQMWSLFQEIKNLHMQPDLQTYTLLSSTCTTHTKCLQLLIDMKNQNVQPNLLILKSLLIRATSTNFDHLTIILEEMDKSSVLPDEEFLSIIKSKFRKSKRKLVKQEQDVDSKAGQPIDSERMREYHQTYELWLKKVEESVRSSAQ